MEQFTHIVIVTSFLFNAIVIRIISSFIRLSHHTWTRSADWRGLGLGASIGTPPPS